jgi:D-glycero-alpha-D-manno-heptose-7-phosphate kinase
MTLSISIPGRINILGNPTDGLEGDFCTISCAVSLRTYGVFEESDDFQVDVRTLEGAGSYQTVVKNELGYNGKYDIVKAAIRRLQKESPEFADKFERTKFRLTTWTDIPPRSGLGGSSAVINMMLVGCRAFYNLDEDFLNDYRLAEICTRVESEELGFTCGYADRYSTLLGGLAYIDYRDKLDHKSIDDEPYATYERLDGYVSEIPMFIVYTGMPRDSGSVHGVLRSRYMEELRGEAEGEDYALEGMRSIANTAIEGKKKLLSRDWKGFGGLMNENHRLIDTVMRKAGFKEGAGKVNNMLINDALDSGAIGAKLTGAGGGGCICVLVSNGRKEEIMTALSAWVTRHKLKGARIFDFQISKNGYIVR